MPTTSDIRAQFLEFFASKGHAVLPSSSLVPHNDPTLMFANAGMNQFKNIFTGAEKPPEPPRAATSQKCVRAGGKHNDLDNVGYTARHHTFFEMLGNFSFGDYFKEGAISHAWELITKTWGIDKSKLCVTVYHTDDEAFDLWKKIAGLPESKIIRIDTNDNFWAMGDTGPCGPCSEIFYDHGDKIPGGPPGSPDADGDRFIEIWNLVFMQYEQKDKDTRIALPKPSIDTGMGLERVTALLQGKHDNYDIDLFQKLMAPIDDLISSNHRERMPLSGTGIYDRTQSNKTYGASHRVIADHLRSSSFLIADGVLPNNEGRGYVLRRIMRRAMRHAHMLGCRDPLMWQLVPTLVGLMGAAYPELTRAQKLIQETLRLEEEKFKETLERGLKLLDEEKAKLRDGKKIAAEEESKLAPPPAAIAATSPLKGEVRQAPPLASNVASGQAVREPTSPSRGEVDRRSGGGATIFPGEVAFKLYDTYGFPLDLTQDILRAENIAVDLTGFNASMDEQKAKARAAWKGSGASATAGLWFDIKERVGATEFLGYAMETAEGIITALVRDGVEVNALKHGETGQLLVNQTPFYGESGGQVGDSGSISTASAKATVSDTAKPLDGVFVHEITVDSGTLKVGDTVELRIDNARRNCIRANHSATHLLHAALRARLGEHVTQKGSLVDESRLRFDITHPKAVTREELDALEAEVNRYVAQKSEATTKLMNQADAIAAGAMALFGEKYGAEVRVLTMGKNADGSDFSVELCGGTHVGNTGDIGIFKIISEGSVSSGVRRIEATTGEGVRVYIGEQLAKQDEQLQVLIKENTRLRNELKKPAATSAVVPLPLRERLGEGAMNKPETSPHAPSSQPSPARGEGATALAAILQAQLAEVITIYKAENEKASAAIAQLQEANKKLNKEAAEAKKQAAMSAGDSEPTIETIGSIKLASRQFAELDAKSLRDIANGMQQKHADAISVLLASSEGKGSVIVAVGKELQGKADAPTLVKAAVAALGGQGGGGKPDFAQGGGPDGDKLEAALAAVKAALG